MPILAQILFFAKNSAFFGTFVRGRGETTAQMRPKNAGKAFGHELTGMGKERTGTGKRRVYGKNKRPRHKTIKIIKNRAPGTPGAHAIVGRINGSLIKTSFS